MADDTTVVNTTQQHIDRRCTYILPQGKASCVIKSAALPRCYDLVRPLECPESTLTISFNASSKCNVCISNTLFSWRPTLADVIQSGFNLNPADLTLIQVSIAVGIHKLLLLIAPGWQIFKRHISVKITSSKLHKNTTLICMLQAGHAKQLSF